MPVAAVITTLEDARLRLDVSVPEDEVRRQLDRTVREVSGRMRLPGFRPGKVPAAVVIQRVGREALMAQTLDRALGEWYGQALKHAGVMPIDDPEVELGDTAETGVSFTATIRVPPTPVLGQYKGLEVVREPREVPEGAAQAELMRIREQSARLEDAPRAAAPGDFVVIDYDGAVDGAVLPGAGARGQLIELGGDRILPAFTESLSGAVAGETRTFAVEYPDDDTRDEIKGKSIDYSVTIQKVQEKRLPEVDDALAESVGFATADEMRAEIDSRLEAATDRLIVDRRRRRATDAAVATATLDVPDVMVDRRIDQIMHDTSHQLPQGVGLEQWLAAQGQTVEEARASLRVDAEMSIRRELVVEAIADAEDITLSDDVVEARVRADAEDAGRDPDDLIQALRDAGGWESLRQDLRVEAAVDLLVEAAVDITPEQAEERENLQAEDAARVADLPTAPDSGDTPVKTADKKPADKKPADKKSGDKKTADKKPVDKKPADKKSGDKKSGGKEPADKKASAKKASDKKSGSAKGTGTDAAKKPAAKKPAAKKAPEETDPE